MIAGYDSDNSIIRLIAVDESGRILGNIEYLKITDSDIMVPVEPQSHWQENITLHSSKAETSSGNSGDIDISHVMCAAVCIDVTAVSGTSPTIDFYLEGKDTLSGKYNTIWNPSTISSVTTVWKELTDLPYRYVRLRWVIGGTSPSFTFSAAMEVKS